MSSLKPVTSRFSSTSTLVNPIPDFEGTAIEQEHKTHFLYLLSFFGRAPVHENYFRSWCLSKRPTWTNIFFSRSGWDTSKFGDLLDELENAFLGSMSGSWWNFEFLLTDGARESLQDNLGKEKRGYIIELSSLLGAHLGYLGPFKLLSSDEQNILQHIDSCIQQDRRLFEGIVDEPSISPTTTYLFANTYQNAGRLTDAERLFEVTMRGEALRSGKEEPRLLFLSECLGLNYMMQGHYNKAEQVFKKNIAGKVKTFGPEHLSTLESMENLANCFKNRGRYAKAEDQFLRILSRVKNPWPSLRNNLAILRCEQGRWVEAEEIFEELVEEQTAKLGVKHPDTLSTMHNLATLYSDLDKVDEAESLARTTLDEKLNHLGPDHPDIFSTIKVVAMLHLRREDPHEAERMLLAALESSEYALGRDHPETLSLMDGLVVVYLEMGQIVKAAYLGQRAFFLSAVRYGSKHPDTLGIVQNLAFAHQLVSDFDAAEGLYTEILREDTTAKYIQIKCTTDNLLDIYYRQGRLKEADQLKERMGNRQF